MCWNDLVFINILNRFRKSTHTIDDIKTINDLCVKNPPIDSRLPYLFYTNKDMMTHNDQVFSNANRSTFFLKQLIFATTILQNSNRSN